MIDIQTILTYLTLISIPVGVAYHIMTLNNTRKNQQMQLETRQAQLFMNIYNQFIRKEFSEDWLQVTYHRDWENTEDFTEKYGTYTNPKASAQLISVLAFFEGIGVLLKRNLINISMVDDLMSSYVLLTWGKYGPLMREISEAHNRPELWEHVHYLYNEIQKTYQKQHGHELLNR